jgi:geranylgeranyl reductase family protein
MNAVSDVIIVGGGPCGSFAAYDLAKRGVGVTVLEEHGEIGSPCHCPGHLSIKGLKKLGLHPLLAGTVENVFRGAVFHSPKGRSFSVRFAEPITCTVNRRLFDRQVARMAEDSGAKYHLGMRVDSLFVEDGKIRGVVVKQNEKAMKEFSAKTAVDAEGISSRILRLAGLKVLNRYMLVNGVHAELENVNDVERDMVEVFFGKDYAPGFYAWLIPLGDGRAKVGLAAKTENPKQLLQRFMHKHHVASKKLHNARVLSAVFHPLTLGGPISKTYADRFLAVGDAASQVKPTTGGGVIFGLNCARIAADVIREALDDNDFSERFLSAYQRRCEESLGFDVKIMLRIRRMLDEISDEKLDNVIGLCDKLGLGKSFANVEDIDFQGKSLMHLFRSPRMLPMLFYSFLLYLSANP